MCVDSVNLIKKHGQSIRGTVEGIICFLLAVSVSVYVASRIEALIEGFSPFQITSIILSLSTVSFVIGAFIINIKVDEREQKHWISYKLQLKFRASSMIFILSGIIFLTTVLLNNVGLFALGLIFLIGNLFFLLLIILYLALSMENF